MWDAHAHVSSAAPAAALFSYDETPSPPPSSYRQQCSIPSAPLSSPKGEALDTYPKYDVDVGPGDVLLLRLHSQPVIDGKGFISPHLVQARLRSPVVLELELHAIFRTGTRMLSVGVWAAGDYVHWRDERRLDFVVLDAVDLALRAQLPPGGGIVTFKRQDLLASAAGVSFRA